MDDLAQLVEEYRQQQGMMGQEPIPEYTGGDPQEYLTNLLFTGQTELARTWAQRVGVDPAAFEANIKKVNEESQAQRGSNIFGQIGELTRVGRGEVTGVADFARDAAGLAAIGYAALPGAAPAGAAGGTGSATVSAVDTAAGVAAPAAGAPTVAGAFMPGGAAYAPGVIGGTVAPSLGGTGAALGGAAGGAGGAGILGSVSGGAGALLPSGGAPNVPGATPPITPAATPAGQGGILQQFLGGLGIDPSQGFSPGNIFGGLQGLAGLGALSGGNDLSDLFGLTGQDAGAFRAVNTATPGGGGTNYNPDTNTLTGTGGNLDPIQAQLATVAGQNITQSGQNSQGNILELLRQQAAPQEAKAFQGINNNLFSRGRLGANDSATGEAYEGFARGQSLADLTRQLSSFGLADQLQTSALGRGLGAMSGSSQLQTRALGPYAPIGNDTRGQASPMFDFFNQFFQRRP